MTKDYTFYNSSIKRYYERLLCSDLNRSELSEEDINNMSLSNSKLSTTSAKFRAKIRLAYILGQLNGIQRLDEGLTPVTLDPLENINIIGDK